jgi:hypothetical protein
MAIFDKYQELMGPRPNGRPVGVRDGFGQQVQQVANPALQGMVNANGVLGSTSGWRPGMSPLDPAGLPQPPQAPPARVRKHYENPMNDPNSPSYWDKDRVQAKQLQARAGAWGGEASVAPGSMSSGPIPLQAVQPGIAPAGPGGVRVQPPLTYLDALRQRLSSI